MRPRAEVCAGVKVRKILITSIGNRVSEAIVDRLESRRSALTVVGVNSIASAAGNFRADTVYLVPPSEPLAPFLARMREILAAERPDLVLAGRDGDLAGLAMLREEPAFKATFFLCPSSAVVAVVRDTHRTFEFARAHGLPFAESIVDAANLDDLIRRKGLPLIGKPRDGHGSIGVTVVRTRDQALAVLAKGGLMLQEFLNVPADLDAGLPDLRLGMPLHYAVGWQRCVSPGAVLGESGKVLASNAINIDFIAGVETRMALNQTPAGEAVIRGYAEALGRIGMIGPINIQCHQLPDGSLVPFEINARFFGSTTARAYFGFDCVAIAVDYFLEGRLPASPETPAEACHIVRPAIDRVVREADIERLGRDGKWTASSARTTS